MSKTHLEFLAINQLKGTSDMQLSDEKQHDLNRLETLYSQLTEPNHTHTFYEETRKEIELLNIRIKQIDMVFEGREWRRDLHRVMNEFKYLTRRKANKSELSKGSSGNALVVKIIHSLIGRLQMNEIKRIIDIWQERLEDQVREKDRKLEAEREKKIERKLLEAAKQVEKMAKEPSKGKRKRKSLTSLMQDLPKRKKKAKEKTIQVTPVTPESVEYWKKKWGISDESEEKKEAS